jgi:hypothetical protein
MHEDGGLQLIFCSSEFTIRRRVHKEIKDGHYQYILQFSKLSLVTRAKEGEY